MTSWKLTAIGEFLFERQGKYKPNDDAISGLKRIEKIDFSGNFYIANKSSNTNMIMIRPGDLVISGINVSKGAMGIYDGDEVVTATIHYSSYTFDTDKINVEYFKRFLKSSEFIRLLQEQVKGGIKTEIKPKHILPLEINLPSLEEQGKTVSHFRSLESEDEELKEEINNQQTLLKKLRQQILQEAIEGKLTADWREDNPDVEPASELLARIKAEKEQLIKDKKIKKQKALPPITDEEKPFDLPDGWEWSRYGDVMLDIEAGKSPTCYNYPARLGEWGVLKISAISWNSFREDENKKLKPSVEPFADKEVKNGDFIMTRANTKELVAKSVIVGNVRQKLLLNDKTLRVAFSRYVSPKYMNLFNNGAYARKHYISVATGASPSMKNISRDNIKILPVPLPPLTEQEHIISKVKKLFAICDQLEVQMTKNQTHAKQLMQAVLKQAFQQNSCENQREVVHE